MACFAALLGAIVLLGFINLSEANKDTCEVSAAVAQSLTLPFVYNGLESSHVLRWTHNNTIIFYRQQGKVSVGKPTDISATGSLLLKNVQFVSSGVYQATLLHPNGSLAKTWSSRLCVMDKVSKPKLTYNCDFKSSSVHLNCHVANPQGLAFSWSLDKKTLTGETKQTLSISLAKLKEESNFTCNVANKISQEMSDTVCPSCKTQLLCFTSKTVKTVLAGGVGLILLLLTIIVIMCCCHRVSKSQMRTRDKGGLRMLALSKREPDSISPEYETMQPTEDCYQSISQPEAPAETRPAQLSVAAEGQQPSPVPKPRTKNPITPVN